jgi:hypothetical protein
MESHITHILGTLIAIPIAMIVFNWFGLLMGYLIYKLGRH